MQLTYTDTNHRVIQIGVSARETSDLRGLLGPFVAV